MKNMSNYEMKIGDMIMWYGTTNQDDHGPYIFLGVDPKRPLAAGSCATGSFWDLQKEHLNTWYTNPTITKSSSRERGWIIISKFEDSHEF